MQGTITISAPVDVAFDQRLRVATALRRKASKAAAIREALELWLDYPPCPLCGQPTTAHPDPTMGGVQWCEACQEAVGFEVARSN